MSSGLDRLERRARGMRARQLVRAFEFRQRHLAAGVWFRLRRVLADAKEAYAISEQQANSLLQAGYTPEPCGNQISPPKILVFIDAVALGTLRERTSIPVSLGPLFLAASAVALVPFESERVRRQ